jgi:hypothetical protein
MTRANFFFGLVLIAVGTLLLLDQLEMVDAWPMIADWWPSVIIVAGVGQLVTRPRNILSGLTITAIGGVLLLWTLGIIDGIGMLWPVLIIALGIWLLVGRPSRRAIRGGDGTEVLALFDDRRDVPVGAFAGGEIVTVFANAALDLREVAPEGDEIALQVTTVFGDVELDVPDTWDVRVSGPEIFGDVNLSGPTAAGIPEVVLRLHVVTIFGDIDIRTTTTRLAPATPR